MDWAELTLVTAISAFFAAAAGAALGGLFTWKQRLRASRSQLYQDLVRFHDNANDRRTSVAKNKEPVGTGYGGFIDQLTDEPVSLGLLFREFDRHAATSSRFDRDAVRSIWPMLNKVDAINTKYASRGDIPNAEAAPMARSLATDQLAIWDELDSYLWRYRLVLEWIATRHMWPFWGKPASTRPDPSSLPPPPKRLRA